jgi:nucleoid-associated protein YgaU
MDRGELEGLDREALVVKAQAAGIRRARILTRPELIDELLRLDPSVSAAELRKSRGFFGKARDLVARVVERGLHLPDAADRIRTLSLGAPLPHDSRVPRNEPQAMPTVTLAEIYAAQGHRARAIETLRRVLEREPEHTAARVLLARLEDDAYVAPPPPLPPEPEIEPELARGEEDDDDDAVPTVETPFATGILGPSDPNGEAEFHLAPPSDDMRLAPSIDEGRTYTFTAPRGDDGFDVDENAKTDVFAVVPEADAKVEVAKVAPAADTAPVVEAPEVDECIAIPLEGGRMYVRWSISWSTIGRLLGAMPAGRFVVRAHVVTPSWDAPETETRDLIIDPDEEQVTLVGLGEPSVVRVAVGWLEGARFVPLAHSPALEVVPNRGLVIWTTKGIVPVNIGDPRSASIARAVDASRRAAQARS